MSSVAWVLDLSPSPSHCKASLSSRNGHLRDFHAIQSLKNAKLPTLNLAQKLEDSNHDHNAIYEEDDDASIVVTFQNADLYLPSPETLRAAALVDPTIASSSNGDLSSSPGTPIDDTTDFQLVDPETEDFLPQSTEHLMWNEACNALRHFGTFALLPLDVQFTILDFLGPSTLLTIRQTNHHGSLIGVQDRFWQRLHKQDFGSTDRVGGTMCSWMHSYQEGYKYYTSATANYFGIGGATMWHYSFHTLWISGSVPMRRWRWDPARNTIFMPSLKIASWIPESNMLTQLSMQVHKKCFFHPASGRFTNSDGSTSAVIAQIQQFPPKHRITVLTSHSMAQTIYVTGTIPIPLLMVLIFRLD